MQNMKKFEQASEQQKKFINALVSSILKISKYDQNYRIIITKDSFLFEKVHKMSLIQSKEHS